MREIKFRVWDNTDKEMLYVDALIGTSKGMRVAQVKSYPNSDLEYGWDYSDDDKVMRYTGLKDKNGVEIYEGDLLKIELDWGYGLAQIIIKVYFENGTFRAKALNSHEDTLLLELPYLEVIGNIYENPELLEIKQ